MPAHGLAPVLLSSFLVWRILTTVSSHPHQSPCQLMQRTALCNGRKLRFVPAELPDNIEELQLNYNNITTLRNSSLLRHPSLNTLSLACNTLENLESNTFENSKLLESLNLANNSLYIGYQETSLALKKLPGLRILDLSQNNLHEGMASLLLQDLTSLEYLNLSGNLLQRLDETSFSTLHQLKDLDLQGNIIFEIDGAFDGNRKLQRLNLAFNYLPCLTDFHMTQLVVLNVSYNAMEWFISRQDLNETFQLETLDLSKNKLIFFPFLPSYSNLQNLYLSHNVVRFYRHLSDNVTTPNSTGTVEFYNLRKYVANVTTQLWDDDLHGDLSNLRTLDLRVNQVEYFPQGFIQKMPSLLRLQVGTNCLETLDLTSEGFSRSLHELDVSNNRLNQIFADNDTHTSLGNLTRLELSDNPGLVVQDSLQSLSGTLQHLGLGNTQIQNIDFSRFRRLIYLNLSRNGLPQIPPSLEDINLKSLDLRDNNFVTIPPAQAGALASKLQTIFLSGNPFSCCQIEWFHTFRKTTTINLVGHADIKCENFLKQTYRVKDYNLPCEETGESLLWYFLLFVPICISFLGISLIAFLTFKPKIIQNSIKKKYLKPTSY